MSQTAVIEPVYNRFLQYTQDTHVILLHPNSRYRSLLVANLLRDTTKTTLYYALDPDDVKLESFLTGMTQHFASQHPTFGYHLNSLDSRMWDNNPAVLDALTTDLAAFASTPFYIILDEFDRSDSSDSIQTFVERLIPLLPSQARLVINSRTLPRLPWMALIAERQALIVHDENLITDHFYQQPNRQGDLLEVFVLGPGFVNYKDEIIDGWEGHLPRLLFFFALDRPMITRSETCQAFWTNLDLEQAVNVFHVTKRRLHKALGIDVLVHEDGYYHINPQLDLYLDVSEFVTLLLQGRDASNPHRIDAYQRAVELYRGPFLKGHDDPWIVERRLAYQAGYLEALYTLADHWMASNRPEYALSVYQHALVEGNAREELDRKIVRLYLHMGRRSEAAVHIQRMVEDALQAARAISPETQSLRDSILAQA
jgi:DNA-binding SARP family transcriptional activator